MNKEQFEMTLAEEEDFRRLFNSIPDQGQGLNILVAEKVMGYKIFRSFRDYCQYVVDTDHQPAMSSGYPCMVSMTGSSSQSIPDYSTNDTLAMDVVRKLGDLGYVVIIKYDGERISKHWSVMEAKHSSRTSKDRDSFAHAVCEAAVALIMGKKPI